jgi:hypothetical protein
MKINMSACKLDKGIFDKLQLDTMIRNGPYFYNINDNDFYSEFNGKFKIYALRRSVIEGLGTGIKVATCLLPLALGPLLPLGVATSILVNRNGVDPSSHYAWLFHFDNSNTDDLEFLLIEYSNLGICLQAFVKQQNMSLYEVSRYMLGIKLVFFFFFKFK